MSSEGWNIIGAAALRRLQARDPYPEIMDTPEKAVAAGVRLGDTVMRHPTPEVSTDPQQAWEDGIAEIWRRENPDAWIEWLRTERRT